MTRSQTSSRNNDCAKFYHELRNKVNLFNSDGDKLEKVRVVNNIYNYVLENVQHIKNPPVLFGHHLIVTITKKMETLYKDNLQVLLNDENVKVYNPELYSESLNLKNTFIKMNDALKTDSELSMYAISLN